MKNVINYYYQLNILHIHQINDIYYFDYMNSSYLFKPFYRNFEEVNILYDLNNILNNNYYHRIMLNKDKMPYTIIDNKCYVLLKLSNLIDDKISIYDLNNFKINNIERFKGINLFNWIEFWKIKIDYLEYRLEHIAINNYNLMPIYHFFIGLGEIAIRYIYDSFSNDFVNNLKNDLVISHRRINANMSLRDFYDPLELVIDHKIRDLSEYIKSMFFLDYIDFDLIYEYLSGMKFNSTDFSLLMGRILFPTFFFDLVDRGGSLEKISIKKYMSFLSNIYDIIKELSNIREIQFLNKKM